jgi:hypothetical protein
MTVMSAVGASTDSSATGAPGVREWATDAVSCTVDVAAVGEVMWRG